MLARVDAAIREEGPMTQPNRKPLPREIVKHEIPGTDIYLDRVMGDKT